MKLTAKQEKVLEFIRDYVQKNHFSPTQKEIQQALEIKSDSFLNYILDKLETVGAIARNKEKSRHNIKLLTSPYSIPLLGKIAAGKPIEAINIPEDINITEKLLGNNRYLLEVKGDSMIEDNICDGDWVVCERCQKVPNGTIVVALINNQDATLKRLFYENGLICLKPANKNYQPQYFHGDEVVIQGKFIGLIRLQNK